MERREFLQSSSLALTACTAGCINNPSAESGDTFERYVSVASVDPPSGDAPVEFEVTVPQSGVTADSTAFLEITTENTSESVQRIQPPYWKGNPASGESGILMYSFDAPDSPSREYAPECIDNPEPTREHNHYTEEGPPMHELTPSETATDEYIVVRDPTVHGCFPTGEYHFESMPALYNEEGVPIEGAYLSWGFTIAITETPDEG